MSEQKEEVANLAEELREKPKKNTFGSKFWIGMPFYWVPALLLSILGINKGEPLLLFDITKVWMWAVAVVMILLALSGLALYVIGPDQKEDKKHLTWNDFVAIAFLSACCLIIGVTIGVGVVAYVYPSSLITVFLVAKILEK